MTPEEALCEQLQREFASSIVVESSSTEYFALLEKRFPVQGSKIDWERVPTAKVRRAHAADTERYLAEAAAFVQEVLESEQLDRECQVIAMGDSAMEKALRMPLSTLVLCLRNILPMPQHTYVLAPDAAWCLVFTMEGDLCFGYAPS
jgi:hypothetical protein